MPLELRFKCIKLYTVNVRERHKRQLVVNQNERLIHQADAPGHPTTRHMPVLEYRKRGGAGVFVV